MVASNTEWKKWGEVDPLMGVATREGKDANGADPWSDEEFYELGRSDWGDFYGRWSQYGLDKTSCIEIGCGAGRITRQLALHFEHVYALDVSEGMIAYANHHISSSSVKFLLVDGYSFPLPNESATAVFSTHVFQHFDSLQQASRYFKEIARCLCVGGTLMIHLPIHSWPAMPSVFDSVYGVRKRIGDVRAGIRRRLIGLGFWSNRFMRGLSYSTHYLFDFLPECGFRDVEVSMFRTTKEKVVHPFVFARRGQ